MTSLRPRRLCATVAISILALGIAGAAHAADQLLVGVSSVRFAWAAASGQPSGYIVSLSLNGSAHQPFLTTVQPAIEVPVSAGDRISIRVAATGYNSSGAYVSGPLSPISDTITVSPSPVFPVSGTWLLHCSTCNTVMNRSLSDASRVLARTPGLADPWRVLGIAKLRYGRDHVIWHNASTGAFAIYDGPFLAPIAGLSDVGPAALRGVGAADLDGDGREEFIVQRTDTAKVLAWGVSDAGRFESIGTIPSPPNAKLVAARDFDLNGTIDLLWYDQAARTLDLWKMAKDPTLLLPLTTLVANTLRVASGLALDASVAAAGDFDGDRFPDVLWRYSDGRFAITYLSAGIPLRQVALTAVAGDVDRRVVGTVEIGGTVGFEVALQDKVTGVISILDPSPSGANPRFIVVHAGSEWRVVAIGS